MLEKTSSINGNQILRVIQMQFFFDFTVQNSSVYFFFGIEITSFASSSLCFVMSPHLCFLPSLLSRVVLFVHARVHVCVCRVCMFVCARFMSAFCSRRGRPPQAQTNAPLSLKAMTSVHTRHRKQAGPAGKENRVN